MLKKARFTYGQRVTLVFKRGPQTVRSAGVVISAKPLVAMIHGSQIAFDQTGKVQTEGFPPGAKIEEAQAGDD